MNQPSNSCISLKSVFGDSISLHHSPVLPRNNLYLEKTVFANIVLFHFEIRYEWIV